MQIDRKIRLNNWYLFVLSLFSVLIIFVSIVFIMDKLDDILAIVLLTVFSTFGFVLIFYLHFTYKAIRIKNNGIQLKNGFYKWTDFKTVFFQPKRNVAISFEFQLDRGSVIFETNDKKKHVFTLNYYKDYNLLKFIALHIDQLKSDNNLLAGYLDKIDTLDEYFDINKESFQYFYPNPLKITYFGIVILGFGFVIFFRNYAHTFLIIFFCFLIFLTGFNYHYFKVSDNYLIIRNLIYFWKRKVFRLENIESVNYGASGDRALVSGLKINTMDYKQHFFASGLTKESKMMILNRINKNNKA
jgi:hypothetical protein